MMMFGLPYETFFLIVGFPLFWITYTLVFLYSSRSWKEKFFDRDQN